MHETVFSLSLVGGQHCDTCVFGFFRPGGVLVTDPNPCSPCECDTAGSVTADCVKVSYMSQGHTLGDIHALNAHTRTTVVL